MIFGKVRTWLVAAAAWVVSMTVVAVWVWGKAKQNAEAKQARQALEDTRTVTKNRIDSKSKSDEELDKDLSKWQSK